jgi:GntR family transcriptional regulator
MTTKRARGTTDPPTVEKVVADLRKRIVDGEFRDGDGRHGKLPSSRELSEHYGLSRQAIVRVIAHLKAEGIVHSRKGAGVWVREWQPLLFFPQSEFKQKPPDIDIYTALLQSSDRQGDARMDEITVMAAEEPVRSRLNLREGEYVAVRRRTNMVDDVPVHTDDSYVPLRIVDGSDWVLQENIERGTNTVLAELGHELVRAVDTFHPRMTRPDEDERLGMGEGNSVPAIELISTAYDSEDRPVQVTMFVLPAHKNITVYERFKTPQHGDNA